MATKGSKLSTPMTFMILGISGVAIYIILRTEFRLQGEVTPLSRLMFTVRWQIVSCLTLLFSIMRVGFARVKNDAIDPLDAEGQRKIDQFTRRLQNTLEQLFLSIMSQLVLSTFLETENLRVIPCLVLLFVSGRILFFLGYPDKRTLGFLITYLPTVGTIFVDLYFLVTAGPIFRL